MGKRWVTLPEVTKKVNERCRVKLPFAHAKEMVDELFNEIANHVLDGRDVFVPRVGVFYLRRRKSRTVKNIATGRLIQLPEIISIGLRSSAKERR